MSDRMETWSINKDEDGGYSQTNGKDIEKIFTPLQVAVIKYIMKDNSEETEYPKQKLSERTNSVIIEALSELGDRGYSIQQAVSALPVILRAEEKFKNEAKR